MKAIIQAIPQKALVDDVVKIVVNHLNPNQQVTVGAHLQEDKIKFGSYAHFKADGNGLVDLSLHPSMGGSYTDVMPMGLFCSLVPMPGQKKGLRLIKKDVTTPLTFELSVYDGIHHIDDIDHTTPMLAFTSIERSYLAKGVSVQEINHGNIRGRLFLPEGTGPFPGVIDMFGNVGNIVTFRSALLASRGFATLCLPYIHYKDLPKKLDGIRLEYFEEAVDGQLVIHCIENGHRNNRRFSRWEMCTIKAVFASMTSIHGSISYTMGISLFLNRRILNTYELKHHPEGVSFLEFTEDIHDHNLIALERAQAEILFIVSGDDKSVMSVKETTAVTDRMKRHGKHNYEMCVYPGAGHLVEPPYSPLCTASYHATMGLQMAWGGELKAHSFAQENSWRKIQQFLRKNLQQDGVQISSML
ncbi:PREDICTED: acyl-coenzyme A amino acid N-acyltransferase 1-like [Priapulus caudatus]|uniref:Acyl-coenzyme A amino acid N-acyltransferase 1-like n=1 Tax=Priapulus caudatus TaxID=37621 RepID=A0ABM1EQW1_PRICU|nr:PREDICTED: acyl-coenzyme A amino acid N-acyltransferase 1-like [Priapulus caudatus]